MRNRIALSSEWAVLIRSLRKRTWDWFTRDVKVLKGWDSLQHRPTTIWRLREPNIYLNYENCWGRKMYLVNISFAKVCTRCLEEVDGMIHTQTLLLYLQFKTPTKSLGRISAYQIVFRSLIYIGFSGLLVYLLLDEHPWLTSQLYMSNLF